MAKRITPAELAELDAVLRGIAAGAEPTGREQAAAARLVCRVLGARHPGGILELRVPPVAAVQLGIGQRGAHTRGTPPNVVETDAATLLRLAAGVLGWQDAVASRAVSASGPHTDLAEAFPLAG
ncbi:MAG: sterol carrier family protein [Propionicimonas sp.]|nr:sterol carrier family protein [Propionicimonas sp.]